MKKYTVILLYPDYLADNYGEETFMTSLDATGVPDAIDGARRQAWAANEKEGEPEDFSVIAVIRGEHQDVQGLTE